VVRHIRLGTRLELACSVAFDDILRLPRYPGYHLDTGRGQHLIGVRAAVAGKNSPYAFTGYHLGRRDARSTRRHGTGVIKGFKFHGLRISDYEILAAPETRVYISF
jgi:hypothetical protein